MTIDMEKNARYSRQTALPEIGEAGQEKLKAASVLCIGAGGLGSPALLYLAAAGIGRIGIADFDRVEESNLQRQVLFDQDSVGQSKAAHAKIRLQALNPEITLDIYEERLNAEIASKLFPLYDIIVDGTDNFETKFLINDAAFKYSKPWVYGAIQGFDGQASVFDAQNGPCYRCLYPAPPTTPVANCAEAGVIGAVAALIGITQALQVIQLITKHESFAPLVGALWVLNSKTMQTRRLTLLKNPKCPVCSLNKGDIILHDHSPNCGFVSEITVEQLPLKAGALLIDVREQGEWDQGHIEGALLCPLSQIADGGFPDVPKDGEIILHCQKGMRSLQAAQILKGNGFLNVCSLAGGYEAWLAYQ